MTIQEMKELKKRAGYTNEQIASLSGVPLGTVQKVFGGKTVSPRYETLQKLSRFFQSEMSSAAEKTVYACHPLSTPGMIKECGPVYGKKKQGEYTLEDYYALPDERRVELIDGVFYDMSAPSAPHQAIIGQLHICFELFVRSRGGSCKIFLPPFDVQLDQDERTIVQPDLVVICRRDRIRIKGCFGAPDLIVEVLSPSTRKKDIRIKTMKYAHAGVREYWMIDPDKCQVLVYDFTTDDFPRIYGFDSKIPVGIWDGALEIDFAGISREISYLYENGQE